MASRAAVIFDRAWANQTIISKIEVTDDFIYGEYKAPHDYQEQSQNIINQLINQGEIRLDTGEVLQLNTLAAGAVLNIYMTKLETRYYLQSNLPKAGVQNQKKLLTLI